MTNEIRLGCPECSMSYGMSSPISKIKEEFHCSSNPAHKFRLGEDGFLKSI